jgi:hypothetical protein
MTSNCQYENAQGHSVDHPSIGIRQPPGGKSQIFFGDSSDPAPSQARGGRHQQKEVTGKPNQQSTENLTPSQSQPAAAVPSQQQQQDTTFTRVGRGGVKGSICLYFNIFVVEERSTRPW